MQTILIVDDAPENLSLLSELLQPFYKVRAAKSGARALQAVVTDPKPDLILLDVMMPEINGYEVIKQILHNPQTSSIPVIFITAMESIVDEEYGLSLGAVDYIIKPFKPAIVLARVKTHLELKAARDLMLQRNVMLEVEIAKRMQENLKIQDISIRALAHLAEIRDPETGNHIRRTQKYVRILALCLQDHPRFREFLTDYNVELLYKSAPLHDIGKVGIPDHILLKQGALTEQEWAV